MWMAPISQCRKLLSRLELLLKALQVKPRKKKTQGASTQRLYPATSAFLKALTHGKRIERVVVTSHENSLCKKYVYEEALKSKKGFYLTGLKARDAVVTCEQLEPVWQQLVLTSAEYTSSKKGSVRYIPNFSDFFNKFSDNDDIRDGDDGGSGSSGSGECDENALSPVVSSPPRTGRLRSIFSRVFTPKRATPRSVPSSSSSSSPASPRIDPVQQPLAASTNTRRLIPWFGRSSAEPRPSGRSQLSSPALISSSGSRATSSDHHDETNV